MDAERVREICLRVYKIAISAEDAQRVAKAYLTKQSKMSNPLLDSLLYFLNNPQKSA